MSDLMIDTDIWIDVRRRYQPALIFLEELETDRIAISTVSLMELIVGCANLRELHQLRAALANYQIEPTTHEDALKAVELIENHWFRQGLGIMDALIAATAIRLSVPLYTRNQRHYAGIRGLSVVVPYR
ncbi:MAG: type II toxin-antitoxin system VapC family toxin [Armatimonadetes bacterium]|nr:type II toxin-antitoxin system VapC family toxin [Armatimonadota bacterium]